MDKVVQQAAAGAEESASLSVEMSNQADKLNAVVDKLAALVSGERGKSGEGPRNVPGAEKAGSAGRSSRGSSPANVKVKKAARSSLRSPCPEKFIPLEMADFKEF
jgi:methyl-accepting chemotaxis protein